MSNQKDKVQQHFGYLLNQPKPQDGMQFAVVTRTGTGILYTLLNSAGICENCVRDWLEENMLISAYHVI